MIGSDAGHHQRLCCYRPNRTATLARLDYKSDPELFFGMRGAGGMLGVAVSMTVKTHPIPQTVRSTCFPNFPQCRFGDSADWECLML